MRVLIITCAFPPEPVVSGQTSAQIADELVKQGHTVSVIAPFPNRPGGRLYSGYSRSLFKRDTSTPDYELIRCFTVLSTVSSMSSRLLENLSFGVVAGLVALFTRRPDVIYSNTWPIFATGIVALVARLRGIPLVVSVQDLYPESLVSQGRLRAGSRLAGWLRSLDAKIVRACRSLIVISDSFAATYKLDRAVPSERIHLVPNWDDDARFRWDGDPNTYRRKRGIPDGAHVLVYSGNVGAAAGVPVLLEAMACLTDLSNLYLIIAGEGSELGACQALARQMGDARILFQSPYPAHLTAELLAAADILLLPTRGRQALVSVPSKLIGYMLAGRPVIAAAISESELAHVVDACGCGWVVPPDRPDALAAQIREILRLESLELARRGGCGRAYALKNYTRQVCLPRVVTLLENAAA